MKMVIPQSSIRAHKKSLGTGVGQTQMAGSEPFPSIYLPRAVCDSPTETRPDKVSRDLKLTQAPVDGDDTALPRHARVPDVRGSALVSEPLSSAFSRIF